jgi:hypothetical protein
MVVTGAGMLWVGWFGFNAWSALTADGHTGMTLLVTHIGAAGGALTWMCIEWLRYGKPSVLGIVTGMVAGLGTITPASGYVGPLGALVIGVTAGIVCFYATQYIKRTLKIDDALDVFSVHGVGGITGSLLTGVFASTELGGMGLANVLAAVQTGINRFDGSLGGLGGCPYAPGASGNICSEDAIHMLDAMGYDTSINLERLLPIARHLPEVVGHAVPGQVAKSGRTSDLHPAPAYVNDLKKEFS